MFLTVCLALVFVVAFYVLWTWNYDYWRRRGVPGPKPNLFYGNTKSFMFSSESYPLELEKMYNDFRNSGYPFVGYFAGRSPQILVTDPILTKEILIKNFTHFYNNEVSDMVSFNSDNLLARNPFFQKSDTWKSSRSELVPGFTINRIKTFYPCVQDVCKKLIKRVNTVMGEEKIKELDIDDLTERFATEVCANVIFGINADALEFNDSGFLKMAREFIVEFGRVSSFFVWTGILPKLKNIYRFNVLHKRLRQFYMHVMKSSVEARLQRGSKDDFLQFLIQLKEKKGITLTDMTGHAMTFFLNGYDTSAIAMAFALYELAKDEQIQDKLRAEIESVAAANNGDIPFDNLFEMEYLDQVINETIRLHPPIVLLVKQCTKSFQFKHPDHAKLIEIDEGTPVMFQIASIHRDPSNFPDPMKFDPDRFSKENGGAKKYTEEGIFLAFGGGPRTCLGMRFALTQVKAHVCEMVRHFKLYLSRQPESKATFKPGHFFNYPSHKIIIRAEKL